MRIYVVKDGRHVSSHKQGEHRRDPKSELFRDRSILRPPMPFVEHPALLARMIGLSLGLQPFLWPMGSWIITLRMGSNQMCYKAET